MYAVLMCHTTLLFVDIGDYYVHIVNDTILLKLRIFTVYPTILHTSNCISEIQIWPKSAVNPILNVL